MLDQRRSISFFVEDCSETLVVEKGGRLLVDWVGYDHNSQVDDPFVPRLDAVGDAYACPRGKLQRLFFGIERG